MSSNWDNGASCSSQSVNVNNVSANVNSNNGSRSACDTKRALVYEPFSAESLTFAKAKILNRGENGLVKKLNVRSSNTNLIRIEVKIIKRHGNLWNKITDVENLYLAERKAGKCKTTRKPVVKVRKDLDNYLITLHNSLVNNTYTNSNYRIYSIYEPKLRLIYTLPYYPDRIVHHAIMNILEPIWDKLFIDTSFACRKGRGQHKGLTKTFRYVRKYKYCAKLDISQFYVNIDHEILKKILRKKLKDSELLKLLDLIIDGISTRDANIEFLSNLNSKDACIMKEKLLIYTQEFGARKAGVPIGNYLSQWFGNLYMNELDTYIKYELKCGAYVRYCDDFILFSNNKEELHTFVKVIRKFLYDKLKLLLSKSSVFPVTRGVDFLGYRMFPSGYVLLRKRTTKRVKKRIKKLKRSISSHTVNWDYAMAMLASTNGWLKWANTYNFKNNLCLDVLQKGVEYKVRGIPAKLNSKGDYEYMYNNFSEDVWKPFWYDLLSDEYYWAFDSVVEEKKEDTKTTKYLESGDGKIYKYIFIENDNPTYKQLGFTKDEILNVLGVAQ